MEEDQNKKSESETKQDPDFMKEKIKQRPLNKAKLLRRTLITATMAVIFGMIACLTFLVLEPVINNALYPEEEPQTVEFPEEAQENEVLPEDMIVTDSEMETEEPQEPVALKDAQIEQVLSEIVLTKDDYVGMYAAISEVAAEARKSMVVVSGVTADVDWFNNTYENEGRISGVIMADNGKEMLILADVDAIEDADSIRVTFSDNRQYQAEIKLKDSVTGLGILTVSKAIIRDTTLFEIKPISLGSSASSSLVGSPIIAVGSPLGTTDSICYGMVTSSSMLLHVPDAVYKLVTTDIYGSSGATGILVNFNGQLVGIIDNSYNSTDTSNLVSAIGITELKKIIQKLSNDEPLCYLGVYGADVTVEVNEEQGVPYGAYITEIDMDSPAMNAGIQSGDVIVQIGELEVTTYLELVNELVTIAPEETVTFTVMRQSSDGYSEMEIEVTLGENK